jgi:hypothetical protein
MINNPITAPSLFTLLEATWAGEGRGQGDCSIHGMTGRGFPVMLHINTTRSVSDLARKDSICFPLLPEYSSAQGITPPPKTPCELT